MRGRGVRLAFLVWMSYVAVFPFFGKFPFFADNRLFSRFEEIALLLLIPAVHRGLQLLVRNSTSGRLFLATFAAYLCFGFVSWISSPISALAAATQLLLELKFPIVLCAFIGLSDPRWVYRRIMPLLKALLVLSLPMILLQYAVPDLYGFLFRASAETGRLWITADVGLTRATGMFRHPSQLAFLAGILSAIFFFRALSLGPKGNMLWFLISAVVLLFTLQRQEVATVLFLLVIFGLATYRMRRWGTKTMISATLVLLGTAAIIALLPTIIPYLRFVWRSMLLAEPSGSEAARVVFYVAGIELANANFPLGVGLGGFGGHAAALFGSPYYDQFSFETYSWFRQDQFLTDTFWPHVAAEAGWLGLVCYLSGLLVILAPNWRRARNSPDRTLRLYARISAFSLIFLFATSVLSAVMTSMFPLMLAFMLVQSPSRLRLIRDEPSS